MTPSPLRRAAARLARAGAGALALAALLAPAPALAADFGISTASLTSTSTQAGAHPDVTTAFEFNTNSGPFGPEPVEALKNVHVSLPPGLVGDPSGIPQCSAAIFGAETAIGNPTCPADTQVGEVTILLNLTGFFPQPMTFPVWNLKADGNQPAGFGFTVVSPNVEILPRARTESDGGIDMNIDGINEAGHVLSQSLTLWGIPADHGTGAPRVAFVRNPTSCTGDALTATIRVSSWAHPADWKTATTSLPPITGCDQVAFSPSISVTPEAHSADAPTGLDVVLQTPQNTDPDTPATSDLRRAVVQLPEGYAISPSAADGLQACDAAGVGIGDAGPANCPDASKVGSATIETPLVPHPLTGPIYLGPSPSPGRYTVFVVVEANGTRIKLRGDIAADPATGQLTTTFDDNPQQPFTTFTLHFDGGDRAVLASPAACGTAQAAVQLTPWAAPDIAAADLSAPVTLSGGDCPAALPFAPSLHAGTTPATAGTGTTLSLHVGRADRTQPLGAISTVTLPQGLVAAVGDVPLCGDADAAAGTCPAGSRVGRVDVASGPGPHPLHLGGDAFLTGPYKGAPYGLALVVRALAGPYDLGTVVVRSAVRVSRSAQLTVETDPLPTILAGIPLRLRSVGVVLDREGFMRNPTSCAATAITAGLASTTGTTATASDRFGLGGCAALPFRPVVKARASRSGSKLGAALHVGLTQSPGQANLRRVTVTLPKEMSVRTTSTATVCAPEQVAADACPESSRMGWATASTPILSASLAGGVYVAKGEGLPKLVILLHGSGLTIELDGQVALTKGRVTTTFDGIPDVPISAFDLDIPRSARSLLSAPALPCRGAGVTATLVGQNGAQRTRTVPLSGVTCGRGRGTVRVHRAA